MLKSLCALHAGGCTSRWLLQLTGQQVCLLQQLQLQRQTHLEAVPVLQMSIKEAQQQQHAGAKISHMAEFFPRMIRDNLGSHILPAIGRDAEGFKRAFQVGPLAATAPCCISNAPTKMLCCPAGIAGGCWQAHALWWHLHCSI